MESAYFHLNQPKIWMENANTLLVIASAIILCFSIILPVVCFAAQSDLLYIHVVDVGQGDAMVVHQPGACTLLIDTGQEFQAERVVKKLEELQVQSLDMVIISHPHIDHFGGIVDILPSFPAARFFDNGYEVEPLPVFESYRKFRKLQPYQILGSGDTLQCGDTKIDVLHPSSPPKPVANINDTSLVLLISHDDFRLLHMGDLAGNQANTFINENEDLKADVIKIAHHGYEDAASEDLLTRVSPDCAVISTSGTSCIMDKCSPANSVLNRLADHDIRYFRTDQDGDIEIVVNDNGYTIASDLTPGPIPYSPR